MRGSVPKEATMQITPWCADLLWPEAEAVKPRSSSLAKISSWIELVLGNMTLLSPDCSAATQGH